MDFFTDMCRARIAAYGWILQEAVLPDDQPPLYYTVGLTGFEHPELTISASTSDVAGPILNELAGLVRDGQTFLEGDEVDLPGGPVLVTALDAAVELTTAEAVYERPVAALQVVVLP